MLSPRRLFATPAALGAAILVLVACGNADEGPGTNTQVNVTSTDETCEVANTKVESGTITFHVLNEGSDATEMYIHSGSGEDLSNPLDEVEDIGPGTTRDLIITLDPGDYQLVCKPGQTGDGIRAAVTVTKTGN